MQVINHCIEIFLKLVKLQKHILWIYNEIKTLNLLKKIKLLIYFQFQVDLYLKIKF